MTHPDALRRATLVSAGLLATLPFARSVLAQAAAASSQPPGLPVAAVRNVRETFFGTPVDDPYRYFEEPMAPEVAAWMKAHSEHAHACLLYTSRPDRTGSARCAAAHRRCAG